MSERLQHLNLGWLYLALIAAGAVGGGIAEAVHLLVERRGGRS
ncbi:hypothetical protein AB0D78_28480 [Streptomyces avermitilis]